MASDPERRTHGDPDDAACAVAHVAALRSWLARVHAGEVTLHAAGTVQQVLRLVVGRGGVAQPGRRPA